MVVKMDSDSIKYVVGMAVEIWKSSSLEELENMFSAEEQNSNSAVFVAKCNREPTGFAQCQLRYDYVEGTKSSPVGYLEGIFVKPEYRHRGYAKELLNACENWATEKGCKEFASDCELSNEESLQFHLSLGFNEANRIICFTKKL